MALVSLLALRGPAQSPLSPQAASSVAGTSLRFWGNGVAAPDLDRVKIPLDAPARPVDVGVGDFTVELWIKAPPGANGSSFSCNGGNDDWINGNIFLDRDVFGSGDFGDWGASLADGRLMFGVANGASGVTACGAPNDPFLVIGAEKHDAGAEYPSFSGWIDELRISTVRRYMASFTPPAAPFATDASTAALYHFDEGTGNGVGDTSGAAGGPSHGVRNFGGSPAGPEWSTDTPFRSLFADGFETGDTSEWTATVP